MCPRRDGQDFEYGKYATAAALKRAVFDISKNKSKFSGSSLQTDVFQLFVMDRFLCRLFISKYATNWILKGGLSILSRIPSARFTTDIDLENTGKGFDQALVELIQASNIYLDDFLQFEYNYTKKTVAAFQKETSVSRVSFDVLFGRSLQKQPLKIDFITSESSIKNIVQAPPANRISLGLAGECDFRLLALEHQIADKVCGMFESFNGYPSSRDKDLIDILLLAMTYSFKKRFLQAAVSEEMNSRNLSVSCDFQSLDRWKVPFERKKGVLPARLAELDIQQALEIAERFLDLDNQVLPDAVWDPNLLIWQQETGLTSKFVQF